MNFSNVELSQGQFVHVYKHRHGNSSNGIKSFAWDLLCICNCDVNSVTASMIWMSVSKEICCVGAAALASVRLELKCEVLPIASGAASWAVF